MTKEEFKNLKDEILVEITAKIEEILKAQLEPLSEALKGFIPNTAKGEDEFERNALGLRVKTGKLLERDGLGCLKAKEKIIERDGWGRRKKINLLRA